MKHFFVACGTRPEAIKLAPVVHALRSWPGRPRVTLCATGQHQAMLSEALTAFELEADINLALMQPDQQPSALLARLMLALGPILDAHRPDVVLVQGDTATALGAAQTAFLHQIPVAHVEAGLRTRDKRAPFPEEINRRLTSILADYHFPPTAAAAQHLRDEGVDPAAITITGNTVVDALYWMRNRVHNTPLPADLVLDGKRLVLITAHRRESFGAPFRDLCRAFRELADRFDDVQLVYPVHLNPNVQQPVRELLADHPRISLIQPQPYPAFVRLLTAAELILTDSGGIQEEAPALGKPTLVLREKTERPEALAAGNIQLVGTDPTTIVGAAYRLLTDPDAYAQASRPAKIYGDGLAAQRIGEVLVAGDLRTPVFEPTPD